MISTTSFIVLSKTPYRESALIAVGISPDYGRFQAVIHGAQKLSGKGFPAADLFRELSVEFREQERSPLQTADNVELLTSFDALADHPVNYRLAGKIGAFLLANLAENVPQPFTYDSLRSVLTHLAEISPPEERWTPEQCAVVIKTAYLYENGLLPEISDEKRGTFLENLVAAGIDNSALPECPGLYWSKLNAWLGQLIELQGLRRGGGR